MRSVDCSNALFALERQSFRPGYSAGRDRFKIDTEKKLKRPPKAASQCADKFAEWKEQGLGEIFGLGRRWRAGGACSEAPSPPDASAI